MGVLHRSAHLKAVELWHHHIQNQKIVNAKLRVFCSGLAIVDRLHLEALAFQNGTDGLRHHFFILDHQHFHTYVPHFVRLFDESTIWHFPEIKLKTAVKVFKKAVFFSASVQHWVLP